MTRLIIYRKTGQLANRLIQFLNLAVFADRYRHKVIYPAFEDYIEHFRFSHNQFFPTFPSSSGSRTKIWLTSYRKTGFLLLYYFIRILQMTGLRESPIHLILDISAKSQGFLFLDENLNEKIAQKRYVFISGWRFKCETYPENALKRVKETLEFESPYITDAKCFVSDHSLPNATVVGVHIRRGDYKYFEHGAYFYEIDQYQQWMRDLKKILGDDIVFIICSNENITNDQFSDRSLNIQISNNHYVTDLLILSMVHYIIGPPSTYSIWASFIGDVPLQLIRSEDHEIMMEKFQPYKFGIIQP